MTRTAQLFRTSDFQPVFISSNMPNHRRDVEASRVKQPSVSFDVERQAAITICRQVRRGQDILSATVHRRDSRD